MLATGKDCWNLWMVRRRQRVHPLVAEIREICEIRFPQPIQPCLPHLNLSPLLRSVSERYFAGVYGDTTWCFVRQKILAFIHPGNWTASNISRIPSRIVVTVARINCFKRTATWSCATLLKTSVGSYDLVLDGIARALSRRGSGAPM